MFSEYISYLKLRFGEKLPGEEVYMKMAPLGRRPLSYYLNLNIEYRNSGVLCHIFPENDEPHVTFIRRIDDGKTHSGQIAFPGGRQDENDESLEQTALREAYEEIGLMPGMVTIIGQLSHIYIPVSRYMVHPFVSFSMQQPKFKISEAEVQSVIPVSVRELANPAIIKSLPIKTFEGIIKEAPCYIINGETIWGATAMMVSELLEISRGYFL